jgi:hypothetical protein
MPRRILLTQPDSSRVVLHEAAGQAEKPLQELIRDNPDLLPVEEFGLPGPLMVVGRETPLPSGSIDLALLSPSGDLILVEFKTGPQNPDFRAVTGQLLDYGSDLWGMSLAEFEQSVAARFWSSEHCKDPSLKSVKSLTAAMERAWPGSSALERESALNRLSDSLSAGRIHYVVVAQKFTPPVLRTIEYLNALGSIARFYAVELIGFQGGPVTAFESRSVLKPGKLSLAATAGTQASESALLDAIDDSAYRAAVADLLDLSRGLRLREEWGALGVSLRLPTPDRAEPLSIAWLFPPGRAGWYGLVDVTFGFDPNSAKSTPSVQPALEKYVAAIGQIPGAKRPKSEGFRGWHVPPEVLVAHAAAIREALGNLVSPPAS